MRKTHLLLLLTLSFIAGTWFAMRYLLPKTNAIATTPQAQPQPQPTGPTPGATTTPVSLWSSLWLLIRTKFGQLRHTLRSIYNRTNRNVNPSITVLKEKTMNRKTVLIILAVVLTFVAFISLTMLVWPGMRYTAKSGEPIFMNGGDRLVITETVHLGDTGAISANYFELQKIGATGRITATQIGRGFVASSGNLTIGTWEVKGEQVTIDLVAQTPPTIVETRPRIPWAILFVIATILAAVSWILGLSAETTPTTPAPATVPASGNRAGKIYYPAARAGKPMRRIRLMK